MAQTTLMFRWMLGRGVTVDVPRTPQISNVPSACLRLAETVLVQSEMRNPPSSKANVPTALVVSSV